MRKFELTVSKQNNVDTIRYDLTAADVYDDRAADKASRLDNIISFQYSDVDGKRSVTSYAHEDTNLSVLYKSTLEKKDVFCLMSGLCAVFEIGTQGIPVSYIVKQSDYVYVNRQTMAVKCVIVPIKQEVMPLAEIPVFFREVLSNLRFSSNDRDNYVAELINQINTDDFSVTKLKNYIASQLESMGLFISKDSGLTNMAEDGGASAAPKSVKVNKLGVMNNMQMNQPMGGPMMGQPMMGQAGAPMGMMPQAPQPAGAPMGMMPQAPQPAGAPMGMIPQAPQPAGAPMGMMPQAPKTPQPAGAPMGMMPQAPKVPQPAGTPMGMMPQAPQPAGAPMGMMPQAPKAPQPAGAPMGMMPQAPKAPQPVGAPMGMMPQAPKAPQPTGAPMGMTPQAPQPTGAPMGMMPQAPQTPSLEGAPKEECQDEKIVDTTEKSDSLNKEDTVEKVNSHKAVEENKENVFEEIKEVATTVDDEAEISEPTETLGSILYTEDLDNGNLEIAPPVTSRVEKPQPVMPPIMPNSAKFTDEQKAGIPALTGMLNGQNGLVGQLGTKPIPHIVRKKTGEVINITKTDFAIGKSKSKADYVIEDNTAISRVHCIIVQKDGVNYIKDNNSTNHTYLNGVELQPGKEMLLKNKTVIQMGDEEFTFLLRKGE